MRQTLRPQKHHLAVIHLLGVIICLAMVCLGHQMPGWIVLPVTRPGGEEIKTATATVESMPSPPLYTSTVMPTSTIFTLPTGTYIPTQSFQSVTLTVVYDNNPFDSRLKTAWGFACLVEVNGLKILFDTGGDGEILLDNMLLLGLDAHRVDVVVLSHIHGDHTGGLDALLALNDHLTIYIPRSFPDEFKTRIAGRATLIEVSAAQPIASHIWTTGEMGTSPVEQALIVETDKGLVVLSGCAHPGVVEIVKQARAYGDVYLVIGGFHLSSKSAIEIEAIIADLKRLGVQKLAPCHCTGTEAIELFKAAFGADFIPAGVGAIITIQP